MPTADAGEERLLRHVLALAEASDLYGGEARLVELAFELGRRGEPFLVAGLERGEERPEEIVLEVRVVEGDDCEHATRLEHPASLGERAGAIGQVEHETHQHALEPALLEGELLCSGRTQPDRRRHAPTGDREHLG